MGTEHAASLRPLVVLPFAITSDAVQVLTLPLRPRRRRGGQFETMDIDAAGSSSQAQTRRALATLATTVTPASIVVDVDDEGVMTLHSFPTIGLRMEEGFAKRMTGYAVLALLLLVGGLGPLVAMSVIGHSFNRLVALEMGTAIAVLFMLIFVEVSNQPSELILPLVLVPLSVAGTLVFTRLLRDGDL